MLACPHCALSEPPQFAAYPRQSGGYYFCMRCGGVSVYYENSRKRGHEVALRKATKSEYGLIRATPEMMLMRRLREKYKEA